MRLDRNFYIRPTKKVAEDLLGKTIVRKLESKIFKKGKIVELEIYKGPEGKAAHSKNGKKTKRNKVFLGERRATIRLFDIRNPLDGQYNN